MDKPKRNRKTTWRLWLIGGSICLIVLCAFVFILQFFFPYRNTTKIKSKEEMFQFVIEHQKELEQIVKDMGEACEMNGDDIIIIYRDDTVLLEKNSVEIDSVKKLYKNFSAARIDAVNSEDIFKVQFFFAYVSSGYDYWGIYYKSDDTVSLWWTGGEVQEENGVYTEVGSFYKYETEKIIDNWYYYQCDTR